jgi:hypothetical protein
MRKTVLFAMMLMALFSCSKAQNECVLYRDFKPDLGIAWDPYLGDTIHLDFDNDGINDLRFYFAYWHPRVVMLQEPLKGFDIRAIQEDEIDIYPDDYWSWIHSGFYPVVWTYCFSTSHSTDFVCRKAVDSNYYYGWYRAYVVDSSYISGHSPVEKARIYVDKMAFCTVPNYKLEWGETRIIDMDNSPRTNLIPKTSAIQVHPNPTSGLVTITGQDLKTAEVFNALGQCVVAATGEGERLTVDLNGLPAGVYFVTITNKEGRKCVQKVVKE